MFMGSSEFVKVKQRGADAGNLPAYDAENIKSHDGSLPCVFVDGARAALPFRGNLVTGHMLAIFHL